jgi:ATP-binding cassette subfamily F protein 3
VALVGPNGAGKSTLLRIAAGVLPFDAGRRELGHKVKVAFYAQHQLEALDPSRTVLAELESVARFDDHPRLRGHLGAFLFSGDDVQKQVGVLSGGEKARLALAKMLLRPANFLVLDEPTNHLDVVACEVLEEALSDYRGTLLFISHDRTLIDALATKIVEVKAGRLDEFLGNYSEWVARVAAGAGGGLLDAAPDAAPAPAPASKEGRRVERERSKAVARTLAKARKQRAALEDEIAAGEAALEALGHRLGDPGLYRDGGGDAVRALEAERALRKSAVEDLYREWERVSAEIEALEQAPA